MSLSILHANMCLHKIAMFMPRHSWVSSQSVNLIWMTGVIELGEINLRPDTGELGREVMQGNVYIGDQPICDDGWGTEEARVACR